MFPTFLAWSQGPPNGPVRGPFWSGSVRGFRSNVVIAMKGITVTVGAEKKARKWWQVVVDSERVAISSSRRCW